MKLPVNRKKTKSHLNSTTILYSYIIHSEKTMSMDIIFSNIPCYLFRELLSCSREHGNRSDLFAVAVKKGEDIVGHVPRQFFSASSLFLQSGDL